MRIYVNKIEIRLKFKIKTGYYLQLLTPETMKILGITKNKITKDKNDENLSYLEYSEVVLVYCNVFNNYYQQNSRFLSTFLPNNSSGQLFDISPKSFVFLKHLILNFHKLTCG